MVAVVAIYGRRRGTFLPPASVQVIVVGDGQRGGDRGRRHLELGTTPDHGGPVTLRGGSTVTRNTPDDCVGTAAYRPVLSVATAPR